MKKDTMNKKIFAIASLILFFFKINCDQKKFVIVIPSYNNKNYYIQNLSSVFSQTYKNYRIIYIDDNSPDQTGQLVEDYLKRFNSKIQIDLIRNKERRGALCNLYNAIHSCHPTEIIVTLDGDDWFANNNVLAILNNEYQYNIYLTFGQYQDFSPRMKNHGNAGFANRYPIEVAKTSSFREHGFLATHLRTFYAWLFQAIKLKDLLHENKFYKMTWDQAFMFPMLEMAGTNHKFIDRILYTYNLINPLNDHKVDVSLQQKLQKIIQNKKIYSTLNKSKIVTRNNDEKFDIYIINNNDNNLIKCVNSIKTNISNLEHIFVITNDKSQIKNQNINYLFYDDIKDIKNLLIQNKSEFILLTNSNCIFEKPVSPNDISFYLRRTKADNFQLLFDSHANCDVIFENNIYIDSKCDSNNISLIAFPKNKFIKSLQNKYIIKESDINLNSKSGIKILPNLKNDFFEEFLNSFKNPNKKINKKKTNVEKIIPHLKQMNLYWIELNSYLNKIKKTGSTNILLKNFIESFGKLMVESYKYSKVQFLMTLEEKKQLLDQVGGTPVTDARVNSEAVKTTIFKIKKVIKDSKIDINDFRLTLIQVINEIKNSNLNKKNKFLKLCAYCLENKILNQIKD